jgi:hypothetical protein
MDYYSADRRWRWDGRTWQPAHRGMSRLAWFAIFGPIAAVVVITLSLIATWTVDYNAAEKQYKAEQQNTYQQTHPNTEQLNRAACQRVHGEWSIAYAFGVRLGGECKVAYHSEQYGTEYYDLTWGEKPGTFATSWDLGRGNPSQAGCDAYVQELNQVSPRHYGYGIYHSDTKVCEVPGSTNYPIEIPSPTN